MSRRAPQTGMRDAFPIVCALGDRFRKESTGLRDAKALVLLVAQAGPPEQVWPAAQELAEALGFNDDYIERMYREAYTDPDSRSPARGAR